MLGELYTTLTFLQGENSLEASRIRFASAYKSDNIIPVGESYSALMDAFQKFKTKKGVYVVCEDKIHLIHSAYIENVGRAFLIGTCLRRSGSLPTNSCLYSPSRTRKIFINDTRSFSPVHSFSPTKQSCFVASAAPFLPGEGDVSSSSGPLVGRPPSIAGVSR